MTEPPDSTNADICGTRDDVRERILTAAIHLLSSGGRDALTTRSVAEAAGIQPPTLYRLFGDKSGLINAVTEHGFLAYWKEKKEREPSSDPIENLRTGWDLHIGFGLTNPALYSLMYGEPRPGAKLLAATKAREILHEHIRRIAVAGRLRVPEEMAANLVHVAGSGTVFALLAMPEDARDIALSHVAREMVITVITTDAPVIKENTPAAAAITLRAVMPDATALTAGERHVLGEWLDRLAASPMENP